MDITIPKCELKHLFRLEATLDTKFDVGRGPYGLRRCVNIKGGSFEGERMKGVCLYNSFARDIKVTIRPGGADHMIVGPDQVCF